MSASNTLAAGQLPQRSGVLGGGRMGAGIAHALLISGSTVVIVERDDASAQAAFERVAQSVEKSIERGVVSESKTELLQRFSVSTDYQQFANAQLVIEAVPEIWDLKVSSLQAVEQVLATDAVLASNTSSLSVSGLAKELERPEKFLGLHFLIPFPRPH